MSTMDEIKSKLAKYKVEAQTFSYPKQSNLYRRKRQEVIALANTAKSITTSDSNRKPIIEAIQQVLTALETKANEIEIKNQNFKLLEEIEKEVVAIDKSQKNDRAKLELIRECRKKIQSMESSDDEINVDKKELLKTIDLIDEQIESRSKAQRVSRNSGETREDISKYLMYLEKICTEIVAISNSNLTSGRKKTAYEVYREKVNVVRHPNITIINRKAEILAMIDAAVLNLEIKESV